MNSLLYTAVILGLVVGNAVAFSPSPSTSSPSAWGVSVVTSSSPARSTASSFQTQQHNNQRLRDNKSSPWSVRRHLSSSGSSKSATSLRAVNIIIAGAPASGKGTQCEIIKEKFGVVHLSTGDMLRAAVSAGTEVGKKAKDFMDSGKLVPDEVIIGVVS